MARTCNCGNDGTLSLFTKCDIHKTAHAVGNTDTIVNCKHEMQQTGIEKLFSQDTQNAAHGQTIEYNAESKIEKHGHAVQNRSVENICMVGLHCCGPLTPAMLDLFLQSPSLKLVVCVSCCYHSMPLNGKCNVLKMYCDNLNPQNFTMHGYALRNISKTLSIHIAANVKTFSKYFLQMKVNVHCFRSVTHSKNRVGKSRKSFRSGR